MTDPNPLVAGTGIQKLRDSGIKVFTGVLEEEAKRLNKVFIKKTWLLKCHTVLLSGQ